MKRLLMIPPVVGAGIGMAASAMAAPSPFIPGLQDHFRKDISVQVAPGSLATLTIQGLSALETVASGIFNIRVDGNSSCAASPTAGCAASVTGGSLVLNDLNGVQITVSVGLGSETDFVDVAQPTALLLGPQAVANNGTSFVVPTGTRASSFGQLFGTVLGTTHNGDSGSHASKTQDILTFSHTILPSELFTVEGTLPVSFVVGSSTITGSASFLATGTSPFLIAPPLANAGPDRTVTCGQTVTLDGTKTTDPMGANDIASYQWFDQTGAVIAQGPIAQVTLPLGVDPVTLLVQGNTGAQTWTSLDVTVNPTPPTLSVPPSVTVQSCSTGTSAVKVPVPNGQVCSGAVAAVGTVTSFNGATVSIPISSSGSVNLPPGSGTIAWVVTGPDGEQATATQSIRVVAPTTLFGSRGVQVDNAAAVNGVVYSGGGGQVLLEPDSKLTQVLSLSPISVQDRVTASLLDTNAGITYSNQSTVHIAATSTAVPVLPSMPAISMTFTGTTPVTVFPTPQSPSVVAIAPGQYGNVVVYSRGQLVLSAGTYAFTSLDLEPQASIVVPSASAESVFVFVQNNVIYRGSTVASGAIAPIFLGYAGGNAMDLGTAFTGTVEAPNASLTLDPLNGQGSFTGEFFAKQITVSSYDIVNSKPFTCK